MPVKYFLCYLTSQT